MRFWGVLEPSVWVVDWDRIGTVEEVLAEAYKPKGVDE